MISEKSKTSSSTAFNSKKQESNQSALGWLIGFVTLLLLGSAWLAWQQPPHPDAYRTGTMGWLDKFRYPIEQNAFKRKPQINVDLNAIFVLDQRVWAAGGQGLIVHSKDGGKSWQLQSSGTQEWLLSITFAADGQQGWAAGGRGTILKTTDGGKSWQAQSSDTQALLSSVTFAADGQQGWAAGHDGTILKTTDGGKSWQAQSSGTQAMLQSITFAADGHQGWAAGDRGTILKTTDGGKNWQAQSSGTQAWLQSITFTADGQQGWVTGDRGTILKTTDGGESWQTIAYRVYPAPWFYAVALIALLIYTVAFWLRTRRINQHGPVNHTIADHVATDRPNSLGDPDFLGARRIAVGLTRFLTNRKTEPPLTLAITGDWGSGKSSLMNYLFASLKREGLRPVWFNAWHHREEQNVLASILAKVHQGAIKPWWHPAGFWFRGRLWWRRHLLWKLLMLITLFTLFYAATWIVTLSKDKRIDTIHYARYLLKIDQPVILSELGFGQLCPGWIEPPKANKVLDAEQNTPTTGSMQVQKKGSLKKSVVELRFG